MFPPIYSTATAQQWRVAVGHFKAKRVQLLAEAERKIQVDEVTTKLEIAQDTGVSICSL